MSKTKGDRRDRMIGFRAPPDMVHGIACAAVERGVPASKIVRLAVSRYLEQGTAHAPLFGLADRQETQRTQ